jgi:oligosaccharide translocation protein RFT1
MAVRSAAWAQPETFAAARRRDIRRANVVLVAFSLAHLLVAVLLVRLLGTLGLILADAGAMALRIAYCLAYLRRECARAPGCDLRSLLPDARSAAALGCAACATLLSAGALMRGAGAPRAVRRACEALLPDACSALGGGFWPCAAAHAAVGAACLAAVLARVWRTEHALLRDIRLLRSQG